MGEKRVSIRTIQGGWKVKDFPDGHQELVRDRSPLREKLLAKRGKKQARHADIHDRHLTNIEAKKARQRANGLPAEKSVI